MIRQTSRDAYNAIKENGLLSPLRWQIYDILFLMGPLTQREIYEILKIESQTITPRFAEMEKMGVIEIVGQKFCKKTKMMNNAYDVTSSLPKKIKKELKESTKNKLKRAIEVIEFYSRGGNSQTDTWIKEGLGCFTGNKAREFLESIK